MSSQTIKDVSNIAPIAKNQTVGLCDGDHCLDNFQLSASRAIVFLSFHNLSHEMELIMQLVLIHLV